MDFAHVELKLNVIKCVSEQSDRALKGRRHEEELKELREE
jgi:hypothetical protein